MVRRYWFVIAIAAALAAMTAAISVRRAHSQELTLQTLALQGPPTPVEQEWDRVGPRVPRAERRVLRE